MKILEKLERSSGFWFLLASSGIFFILRFPSLFEPNWYGDEGVYQALSFAMRNGRLLYQGIWDNKPPLLYLIYEVLGSDQFFIRLASLIFGVVAIILFFNLSRKIFSFRTSAVVTSIFVLLLGLPILEGNIANAENFMLLPTIASAFIIVSLRDTQDKARQFKNTLLIFLSGFLLSLSFLFKIVAIFDFGAFLFLLFFMDANLIKHLKNKKYQTYEVKKLLFYIFGFLLLPVLIALFFLVKGAFPYFINATFFSNIGYVGYGNSFVIPQGLLILKITTLLAFSYFIFLKRKILGHAGVLALLWFSFSLFNAFFSQRPYTHYLLVLLPSFCILLGFLIENKKLRSLNIVLILVSLFLITKNFNFYEKILPYYGNFFSFISNNKSVSEYQRFFDRITPVDYELASFIKFNTKPQDYIFTWGNNAQIYKLTDRLPPGRYTVAYHITGSKTGITETESDLNSKKPKFIIIMPYMNYFPFKLTGYSRRIVIDEAYVYERTL